MYNKNSHQMLFPLKVIIYITFSIGIFWGLISFQQDNIGRLASFFWALSSGLVALFVLCRILLKRHLSLKTSIIVLIIFILRVFVGLFHYLLSFDAKYFNSVKDYVYLWDYEWLHSLMVYVSNFWRENGFGMLPIEYFGNKHAIIIVYMSLLYFLGAPHYLNIIILNSLHAVFVAVLVWAVSKFIKDSQTSQHVLYVALLQPFGLGSSIMWRDSVGQLFVIAAITLLIFSKTGWEDIFVITVSSCLMFINRSVYMLTSIAIYITKSYIEYVKCRTYSLLRRHVVSFMIVIGLFALVMFYNTLFKELTLQGYLSEGSSLIELSWSPVQVLIRFVKHFVGPFPWYQVFDRSTLGREYLYFDMLQSAFNFTIVIMIGFHVYNNRHRLSNYHYMICSSVFYFMFSGLISYGHTPYVTVASVYGLSAIDDFRVKKYFINFMYVFFGYVTFNLIYYLFHNNILNMLWYIL